MTTENSLHILNCYKNDEVLMKMKVIVFFNVYAMEVDRVSSVVRYFVGHLSSAIS